jgi:hypothetical protein
MSSLNGGSLFSLVGAVAITFMMGCDFGVGKLLLGDMVSLKFYIGVTIYSVLINHLTMQVTVCWS